MNNEQRLDFVIGQVVSLKAFCVSVIVADTNPSKLSRHFLRASEIATAKILPTHASDAMMEGIDSIQHDLLKVLNAEVARKKK